MFKAQIEIIGVNPFVFVPGDILAELFEQHKKDKGPIPVKGTVNGNSYRQTLVKYRGEWRLYINSFMLNSSPKRLGEMIELSIELDTSDRSIIPHPKLIRALSNNQEAKNKFDRLSPSLQKEIVRYISFLKTDESIDRNIERTINFLLGTERFIGREPIK